MPWTKVCSLPVDPVKRPDKWTGPAVSKLKAKDPAGAVIEYFKKNWKKFEKVAAVGPVLDVVLDEPKGMFRLTLKPPDKASPAAQKAVKDLPAKLKKVFLDYSGNEHDNVADDAADDDHAPPPPAPDAEYHQLLADVGPLAQANPKVAEVVKAVEDVAAKGDYAKAVQTLRQIVARQQGAAAASKVAAAINERPAARAGWQAGRVNRSDWKRAEPTPAALRREERLGKLGQLDAAIAAKAGDRFKAAVAADAAAFAQTLEPPRPVAKLAGLSDDAAKAMFGNLDATADVSADLADALRDAEAKLKAAIRGGKKDAALADAKAAAIQLVAAAPDDLKATLLLKGEAGLRAEVVKAMGVLREKYAGAAAEDLSDDKQRLVDATVAGLSDALADAAPAVATRLRDQGRERMTETLAAADPAGDLMFDLTLKSGLDLKADAAVALGLVSREAVDRAKERAATDVGENGEALTPAEMDAAQLGWVAEAGLTPAQMAAVDAAAAGMLAAIDAATPNTMSADGGTAVLGDATFTLDAELGKGGLGTVSRFVTADGRRMVVKSLNNPDKRLEMERELRIHRLAQRGEDEDGNPVQTIHPNITPLRGVLRGADGGLHMMLDEAPGGDLKQMAGGIQQAVARGALPPAAAQALARSFVRDAVAGLKAVQACNLTHHDIKAENYLIGDDGRVMVADFGSGQVGRDEAGTVPGTNRGTYHIATTQGKEAPELRGQTVTGKADTYTLGVMIRDLMGGRDAPAGAAPLTAAAPPTALAKLTQAMMSDDPAARPTLAAVENSSFLIDAGADDPEQVAALRAAAVGYATATAPHANRRVTADWLAEQGVAGGPLSAQIAAQVRMAGKPFTATETVELLTDQAAHLAGRVAAAERDAAQAAGGDPAAAAEARETLARVTAEHALVARQLDTVKGALDVALAADPACVAAKAALQEAAAPFSQVGEPVADPLPAYRERFARAGAKAQALKDVLRASDAHAKLTQLEAAVVKAFDGGAAESVASLYRYEDYVATLAGHAGLRRTFAHILALEAEYKTAEARGPAAVRVANLQAALLAAEARLEAILAELAA